MRRRYEVEGAVQGVGFRYFVRRQAMRLGLAGWVRNKDDGSVEAEAVGSAERLEEFEVELRRGPAYASVRNLKVIEVPDEAGSSGSFEIV
jgi:acylphosphatase